MKTKEFLRVTLLKEWYVFEDTQIVYFFCYKNGLEIAPELTELYLN